MTSESVAKSSASPDRDAGRGLGAPRPSGRPKVAEAIIADIRSRIATGQLALGSRLPNERDLARHFAVSQPTVREAIRALDAMGLIEVRHGSGAFVADNVHGYVYSTLNTLMQMRQVGINEVLDIRQLLAVWSVSRAASEATDEDLHEIETTEQRCREADTVLGMAETVIAFQAACSAAAHNPLLFALETFLIRLLMQLELTAEGHRGADFWRDQTARFTEHRQKVSRSLASRDPEGAAAAMQAYCEEQRAWFAADPMLSTVRLSDPRLVGAINDVLTDVPNFPVFAR
jgi:GntR family transcriptional repressor for pyruvate dehydrogenase complex